MRSRLIQVTTSRGRAMLIALLLFAPAALPAVVHAQGGGMMGEGEGGLSQEEITARQARAGAGLEVGPWLVHGLPEVDGADYGEWPEIAGFFKKGLDLHLALVSGFSLWHRKQESTSGGLGGSSTDRIDTYIIPMMTAIRFYPAGPEAGVQPYMQVGAGFALGVDDRESSGSGGLGFGFSGGTAVVLGFGVRGGAGVELQLADAYGLTVGGSWQWLKFQQELGGTRTYQGFGIQAGLSYHFQYK